MAPSSSLEDLRPLYESVRTIAVVGASTNPRAPGGYVPRYLKAHGYRIVPVNPSRPEVLGEPSFPDLRDVDVPVDVVQVFRPADEAPAIATAAAEIGAKVLWLQPGIRSEEAAAIGRDAGLTVVTGRCMGVVHGQLGLGPGVYLGDEWHRGLNPRVCGGEEEPFLRVVAGPELGREVPIGEPFVLEHVRVSRDGNDQVLVEDLDSPTGLYVNGARVERARLAVGDTVQVGILAVELALPDVAASRPVVHDRSALVQATAVRTLGTLPAHDAASLRAEFPVLERVAYLNAGADGPVPRRALEATAARVGLALDSGRAGDEHARQLRTLDAALRRRLAGLLGCSADEVALTGSTADGVNTVVSGLYLRRRDEILCSDEEHLAVRAPLAADARRAGVDVRTVPWGSLASEVGPRTRLVVCSHVSHVSGRVADAAALARTGAAVLLDGAQALGAIPVDVAANGCDFYAASGQKWLCGPEGTGCLYVRRERIEALRPPWPSELTVGDAASLTNHADARRFDTRPVVGALATWALAALEVLDDAGLDWVLDRGPRLAGRLAEELASTGRAVRPRGRSTLVSWSEPDPEAVVARLAAADVVVRAFPAHGVVRASVGAWNDENDLARLIGGLT